MIFKMEQFYSNKLANVLDLKLLKSLKKIVHNGARLKRILSLIRSNTELKVI